MTRHPLSFRHFETIFGHGFVARVRFDGQLIAERMDPGLYLYGVYPGGFAASGPTLPAAFNNFRAGLRLKLFETANTTRSFEAFESEVQRFFHTTTPKDLADWGEARKPVLGGRVALAGYPRDSEARVPNVAVEWVALTPAANVVESAGMRFALAT